MKIDSSRVAIEKEKLLKCLLVEREVDDKSKYLKSKGYTLFNWKDLEGDIRKAIDSNDAKEEDKNPYGQSYKIKAKWQCPNGNKLSVIIILMKLKKVEAIRFITLYPCKEGK